MPGSSGATRDLLLDPEGMDVDSAGASVSESEMEDAFTLPLHGEEEDNGVNVGQVCDYIARWYLQMEGPLSVASLSVQKVCLGLSNIIEFSHIL